MLPLHCSDSHDSLELRERSEYVPQLVLLYRIQRDFLKILFLAQSVLVVIINFEE
jgi:hypothetical protein